jgi:hypothetical protein
VYKSQDALCHLSALSSTFAQGIELALFKQSLDQSRAASTGLDSSMKYEHMHPEKQSSV